MICHPQCDIESDSDYDSEDLEDERHPGRRFSPQHRQAQLQLLLRGAELVDTERHDVETTKQKADHPRFARQ